jgi:hypothetical protein
MNVGSLYRIDKYFPRRAIAGGGGRTVFYGAGTQSLLEVQSLGSKTPSEIIESVERM